MLACAARSSKTPSGGLTCIINHPHLICTMLQSRNILRDKGVLLSTGRRTDVSTIRYSYIQTRQRATGRAAQCKIVSYVLDRDNVYISCYDHTVSKCLCTVVIVPCMQVLTLEGEMLYSLTNFEEWMDVGSTYCFCLDSLYSLLF